MMLNLSVFSDFIAMMLSCKLLTNLGKITFVVFLTHVNVIKLLYGGTRVPYELSLMKIVRINYFQKCGVCANDVIL